jgi:hypothetical protein
MMKCQCQVSRRRDAEATQRSRGRGGNEKLRVSYVTGRGRKKRSDVNGRGKNATSSGIVRIAFDESKRPIVARGKNVATAMHVPDPDPGPRTAPDRPTCP